MKRLAAVTALLVVLAGCGTDNNDTNNTTTNSTSNNVATNNVATNNVATNNVATNNVATNNVATNGNTNTNPRTEPYVTQFVYYAEDENALGGNSEGFTVSVISGDISNEGGNSRPLTEEDLEAFETTHLTAATMMKMRDGWGCRVVTVGGDMGMPADMGTDTGPVFVDEATHWFEVRIQEGGSNREVQEITGCVQDADPDVMAIIEALEDLGQRYL